MAGGAIRVDESKHVAGRSAEEVSLRIRTATEALSEHTCAVVGPGTHKLVRAYRRRFRLFTTHTDVCTITVVEAPQGVVVTTVGSMLPQARTAVEAALAAPSHPVAPAQPATPSAAERGRVLVPRRPAHVHAAPAPPAPTTAPTVIVPVLRFPSGKVVPLIRSTVVVGRDPVAGAGDTNAHLVAIVDDSRTVSKSHFACGIDAGGLWIEDRHSTNGTVVTDRAGRVMELTPGRRTPIPADVAVTFGGQRAAIVASV